MKIVVPMAGKGRRFKNLGSKLPKPLIPIDGKPMIEHVCNLFPGEEDFIFICNKEHAETTNILSILKKIKPQSKIVTILPHDEGPVVSCLSAKDLIDDDDEVIVNYCDFTVNWNYQDFLKKIRAEKADGAVVSFKGFHPASLGTNYYAYMRTINQMDVVEVKEKESFSNDRKLDYASTGTYYFSSGKLIKKYFQLLVNKKQPLQGEYYVSLVYNPMIKDAHRVVVYEVKNFICWGTPNDLNQYLFWSDYFKTVDIKRNELAKYSFDITNLVPMAGKGTRFLEEGYGLPKPLIPVFNTPMSVRAIQTLPRGKKWIFLCLKEHIEENKIEQLLKKEIPHAEIIPVEAYTQGMACTCLLAENKLEPKKPLMIGACDYEVLWDINKFRKLAEDKSVDVIIWTSRNHYSVARNPKAYAYLKLENDTVIKVSEKVPISVMPEQDHAVVSNFYFKSADLFIKAAKQMIKKGLTINGEYYVATAINELISDGKKVVPFEVEKFICWGTPQDLREFDYWQSYFDETPAHPYKRNH